MQSVADKVASDAAMSMSLRDEPSKAVAFLPEVDIAYQADEKEQTLRRLAIGKLRSSDTPQIHEAIASAWRVQVLALPEDMQSTIPTNPSAEFIKDTYWSCALAMCASRGEAHACEAFQTSAHPKQQAAAAAASANVYGI